MELRWVDDALGPALGLVYLELHRQNEVHPAARVGLRVEQPVLLDHEIDQVATVDALHDDQLAAVGLVIQPTGHLAGVRVEH